MIRVRKELLRISRPDARLIFFDPNISFIVKAARVAACHRDDECPFEQALAIMDELGYRTIHSSVNTLFSLPLSGGYVGVELVPNWSPLHDLALSAERRLEDVMRRRGWGRSTAWRYLIVGDGGPAK